MSFNANGTEYELVYDSTAGILGVIEESSGDVSIYYIREPGGELIARLHPTEGIRYYHFDELGSTRLLTDGSGNVTDRYAYDTYGSLLSHDRFEGSVNQPYQYVGQLGYYTHWMEPDFGLLQLGVRFYDPEVGRFAQQDHSQDGLNWYGYVSCMPMLKVDPSGLWTIPDFPGLGPIASQVYRQWWRFYFEGGGRTRTLRELGVYDAFWNSDQVMAGRLATINRLSYLMDKAVRSTWHSACLTGRSKTLTVTSPNKRYSPVFGIGPLLPLGHSNYEMGGHCTIRLDCCRRRYCYACTMRGRMWDAFEDVRDIGNQTPGMQEIPGGTAYDIEDTWSDKFRGCAGFP